MLSAECEEIRSLMMGLMDDELDPDERVRVNDHLIRCQACREEYEVLVESCDALKGLTLREPEEEELERLWRSPFSRLNRNAGLALVLGGYAVLFVFVLWQILFCDDGPIVMRSAVAAVFLGFAMLIGSVVRERLATMKTDPYREVKR